MKKTFKGRTIKQLQELVAEHGSISKVARVIGASRQTLNAFVLNHGGDDFKRPIIGQHDMRTLPKRKSNVTFKPVAGGKIKPFTAKRETLRGKRFVFTSAQNNTRVNKAFWDSLQTFCEYKGAKLYVSRFTYNKTGFQNAFKEQNGLWYDKIIDPYILDNQVSVAGGLVFCGELDILPTANDPLSGFDSYAGYNSAIIPHAKVALRSLPRLKGELPRFLYTTGTVTQRNYIQRKAGQKAEFHHVYGALYVEVDKAGFWFARQLIADSKGAFHDLEERFDSSGVTKQRAEGVNWGDIHIEKSDKQVFLSSWAGGDSILQVLAPRYQFIHDLTDFSARNHHEIGNPYFMARKHFSKEEKVEDGLKKSFEFLSSVSKNSKVIVVESNHHEAFERWLRSADGHRDPENAEYWHRCNARIFQAIAKNDKSFDVYEWAIRQQGVLDNVQFLKVDESFTICGVGKTGNAIECGIHGHLGVNGARGTSGAYRAIGRRVNVGHTHSAAIMDGVYCAGVSGKLDMDYNRGPSSWSHSHIVTYANGKRAIITIKNGKWRA